MWLPPVGTLLLATPHLTRSKQKFTFLVPEDQKENVKSAIQGSSCVARRFEDVFTAIKMEQ